MEKIGRLEQEIKISVPTPDDARGIQDVFYKTWLATYPNTEAGITVEDIEDKYKDSFTETVLLKRREKIANPPAGHFYYVAKDGEKVVGICRVYIEDERNELGSLYVLPEYQGRGLGQSLWEEAQKKLDPDKDTFLGVATYNDTAISFYKKIGFEDTGKRFFDDTVMKSGNAIPEMEMILRANKKL